MRRLGRFLVARSTWVAVRYQVVGALLFIPLFVLLAVGIVALPWCVVLIAALERRRVLWLGRGETIPEPPGGYLANIWQRTTSGAIWRHEFLVVLLSQVMGLLSLAVAAGLGVASAMLIAAPVLAGPETAYELFGWQADTVAEALPLCAIGVVLAITTIGLMVALTGVQARAVRWLLTSRESELGAALGTVTRSRATLVDAFEAERRRIERDLHDGAQQGIVATSMTVGLAASQAERLDGADDLRATLAVAQDQLEGALAQLRRTTRGISPQVLRDRGLGAAVHDLAENAGLPVAATVVGSDAGVSTPAATGIYFAISEALANVAKHAGAETATVVLTIDDGSVVARVTDDGHGGASLDKGTGLRGLRERLQTLGGDLTIDSPAGGPTIVVVSAPLVPPWGGTS